MANLKAPKTTWSILLIGFVFWVLLPGFLTTIAPVSWVRFERVDNVVAATTKTCLFFVIPYKTQHVRPVVRIGEHFIAGTLMSRRRGQSERQRVRSESEAFLEIHGEGSYAEVAVSPVNIRSVVGRSKAFLEDASAKELKLTVIGNWKFGLFVGGLLSLLTVLYFVGIIRLVVQSLWRLMRLSMSPSR